MLENCITQMGSNYLNTLLNTLNSRNLGFNLELNTFNLELITLA